MNGFNRRERRGRTAGAGSPIAGPRAAVRSRAIAICVAAVLLITAPAGDHAATDLDVVTKFLSR